jgi:YVTN family beta-propeller protein
MKKRISSCFLCMSLIVTALQVGSSKISADSVSATITAGETEITINSTGDLAYAPTGPTNVKVVNIATNVVSNIVMPFGAVQDIAIDPLGIYAYVTHKTVRKVSKVRLSDGVVITSIDMPQDSNHIVIDKTGTYAYVDMIVLVGRIRLSDLSVVTLSGFSFAMDITIDSRGDFGYVSDWNDNNLKKIDLATFTLVSQLNGLGQVRDIVIDPNDEFAYIAINSASQIKKIKLSNFTVVGSIAVGGNPWSVAVTPSNRWLYSTNNGSGTISKINLASSKVSSTITVGAGPKGIAITPNGTIALVVNGTDQTISKVALTEKEPQSVTFDTLPDVWIGLKSFSVVPASSSVSDLPIVVSSSTLTVCTVDGLKVQLVSTGTCTLSAAQAGNVDWLAAANVEQSFNVAKKAQSITFKELADTWIGKKTLSLDATSTSSLTVTVTSSTPTVCTVDGLKAQLVSAGTCTLSAEQAGDADWLAATKVEKSFKVTNQVIAFTALPDVLLSAGKVTLSASATSALTIAFSSSTPSVCEVAGSTVTLVSFGACTISANQDGGGTDKAAEVRLTFQVLADPGVSILDSLAYTNTKAVTLNLVWPRGATEARISNDGGFSRSKTSTVPLSAVVNWKLDDSRAGAFTKIVYVRFNGTGIDTTKTYTDDIILDTTAPELQGATATAGSVDSDAVSVSSLRVKKTKGAKIVVRAYDRLSGIGFIEVRSKPTGKLTKIKYSKPKAKSQTIRVRTTAKKLQIRVTDRAGNRSGWRYVSVK